MIPECGELREKIKCVLGRFFFLTSFLKKTFTVRAITLTFRKWRQGGVFADAPSPEAHVFSLCWSSIC